MDNLELDEKEIKKGIQEIKEFCGFDVLNYIADKTNIFSKGADLIRKIMIDNLLSEIINDINAKRNTFVSIDTMTKKDKYSHLIKNFRDFQKGLHRGFTWHVLRNVFCVIDHKTEVVDINTFIDSILCVLLADGGYYMHTVNINNSALQRTLDINDIILEENFFFKNKEEVKRKQLKKATESSAEARGKYIKQAEKIWVDNELWKYNTIYALQYYDDMIKQHRIYSNNGEDEETIREKSIHKLKTSWLPKFRKKYNKTNK